MGLNLLCHTLCRKKAHTGQTILVHVTFLLLLAILLSGPALAADYTNIGFKKDVSPEIRKQFPMIDEFIDVQWIDADRLLGKIRVDQYVGHEKASIQYRLVLLEKPGTARMFRTMDFVFYRITAADYESTAFNTFMKAASHKLSVSGDQFFATKGRVKREFWRSRITGQYETPTNSMAGFTKTIAILYPDQKTALVVEQKKPFLEGPYPKELERTYNTLLAIAEEGCHDLARTKGLRPGATSYECRFEGIRYADAFRIAEDGSEAYVAWISATNVWGRSSRDVLFFPSQGALRVVDIDDCRKAFFEDGRSAGIYLGTTFYAVAGEGLYLFACNLTNLIHGGK